MSEVYPQSGVFWFKGQRDAVMYNGKEPEHVMSRATDVFFSKDVQKDSSARGKGRYKALDAVVLDACLSKYPKQTFSELIIIKGEIFFLALFSPLSLN